MKKITSYQTTDGQTFTDKQSAANHEKEIEAAQTILHEFSPIFSAAPEAKRLVTAMIAEPQFFIDALADLAKAKAKMAKKETAPAKPLMSIAA